MGGPGQHPCTTLTSPKVRLLGSDHRDLTQVRFTPESTDFPTPHLTFLSRHAWNRTRLPARALKRLTGGLGLTGAL